MTRSSLLWPGQGPVVLILSLAALGVGASWLLRPPPGLPGPGSPVYQEYLEAFQVGVAALDADRTTLALNRLTQASERIPQEPAAWADRGLLYLRNHQLKEAAADLEHAHKLAPENSRIESLLGLLAQEQGRFAEAAAHFRKVAAQDPNDLPSRFALARVVAREGGPAGDAAYQNLLEDCLRLQPYNLRLLRETALTAARRGDRAALRDVLDRYRRLAPDWSPVARAQLEVVEKAAAGPLPGSCLSALNRLDTLLQPEPGYARSVQAVEPSPGEVGQPLYQFVRLAPPHPVPAAPDMGLAFTARPLPAFIRDQARWNGAWPVWLTSQGDPVVFEANGREVRRIDGGQPALEFPGGPKAVPPTSHGLLAMDWNNDYRTDLLLAGAGGLRFWEQTAEGNIADVTARTGLGSELLGRDCYGAWGADIEMDGDLDVVLAPRAGPALVLRNNRDGTFRAVSPFPGVEDLRAFAWADLDNDGAPDAILLDAGGRVHVFTNERSG
ncbi:MAG: VCBS repeat-containing protein, partial [Planctomycetes bacterium]|nr:VCBS repeat-containing protein [Planctomycetota bacterium]